MTQVAQGNTKEWGYKQIKKDKCKDFIGLFHIPTHTNAKRYIEQEWMQVVNRGGPVAAFVTMAQPLKPPPQLH